MKTEQKRTYHKVNLNNEHLATQTYTTEASSS